MAAFLQTIIGAVASILGGYLGVRWQARTAGEVARGIRHAERREQALFALNARVAEVAGQVDFDYRSAEADPDAWYRAWAAMHRDVAALRDMWETDVSGKIPDRSVQDRYHDVRRQFQDCINRFGTPASRLPDGVMPDEFIRDAGRLLALLGWLRNEVESKVEGLVSPPARTSHLRRRLQTVTHLRRPTL